MADLRPDGVRLVGPYRLEHLVGKGGMGEVYAGFDERLDRPVALKRVWPGHERNDRVRKRFQREARALARLHHPAIVQVFDWVETRDGDWIVMELVDGHSLRHHLRKGPLEPGRVARLAWDVLEGLAVAHGAGLVHRDLKAENVVVATASAPGKAEQAKILDFGLAKRFDAALDETQPSLGDRLAGTLTAMSPEQCHGREVGPRSDLFSLGSLLYEMTTGMCPFHGENPAATIHRICTWIPPSAHSLNPAVPDALSALIEHLMEKDLRRRPKNASQILAEIDAARWQPSLQEATREPTRPERQRGRGASAIATLAAGMPAVDSILPYRQPATEEPIRASSVSAPGSSVANQHHLARWIAVSLLLVMLLTTTIFQLWPPPETLYVAVPKMESTKDGGRENENELAAHAVGTALVQGLLTYRHLAVVVPESDDALPRDPVALARILMADEVLTSNLECAGRTCRLVLRRLSGADGNPLWITSFSVDPERPLDLSLAIIEHLRGAYPEAALRPGIPDLEVRAEDYEAFLRLKPRFDNREAGFSTDQLVRELERLESSSPRYLDLPLFAASALVRRFAETRDPNDLRRARAAVARGQVIAPEDPRTLMQQVGVMSAAGELDEAEVVLERLRRLEPGNAQRLHLHAQLLARKGQHENALAMMHKAVAQLPSAAMYFNLGNMLYRRGEVEGARQALEASLEIAPRFYNGLSLLAQLELVSGDPERAAGYYEELVSRSPATAELSNTGLAYLLIGRYHDAARRFRQALELAPDSPSALLNLADAELLVGREVEAKAHYRQLLKAIERDPQPEKLLTVRAQAQAHLGHVSEALEAVHEALRLAPESTSTAYEASLVFAVLGDRASGLWHAQRALALGLAPHWFNFPWFDTVRADLPETVR